nr:uncharacterized protein LOC129257779 [Lytechinus pictus]
MSPVAQPPSSMAGRKPFDLPRRKPSGAPRHSRRIPQQAWRRRGDYYRSVLINITSSPRRLLWDKDGIDTSSLCERSLQRKARPPAIFADPAYSFINHIILSTSTLSEPAILIGGSAPVVPNGLGIGYTASDDSVGCHVTSYPDSLTGSNFVSCVADCWIDIHDVLSRTNKQ